MWDVTHVTDAIIASVDAIIARGRQKSEITSSKILISTEYFRKNTLLVYI